MYGVARNRSRPKSELSGVVQSREEASGVLRNRPESFGVVRSCPESTRVGVIRSRCNVLVIRHFISLCCFVFHFARALRTQAFVSKAYSGFRTTLDDSGRLQAIPDGSRRNRTIPDIVELTYLS